MIYKTALIFFLVFCSLHFIFAQEDLALPASDGTNRGDGFVVTLDMGVDAFNFTQRTFGSSEIRGRSHQDHSEIHYVISNWNFDKDAQAGLEYSSANFGGKFAFQPQIVSGAWSFGAKLNGWAQFPFFRITLGNDIETNYADWQGSVDAMMVFSQNGWENPDNITNSEGLLLETFLNSWSVALAAGNFLTKWDNTSRIFLHPNDDNVYIDRYETSFSFGGRIGYNLGDIGKVNASYKLYYFNRANNYGVPGGDSIDLVAYTADATEFRHVFGLYSSFNLLNGNLGISAGYLGNISVLLSEFSNSRSVTNMVETGVPVVLRSGPVLNASWRTPAGLTIRTDNAFTFWQDKDFEIFRINLSSQNLNYNTSPKTVADNYRLISNIALRNGIGFGYFFSDKIQGSLYIQNILLHHQVVGYTPLSDRHIYTLVDNMIRAELGLTYHFNDNAQVYIKFDVSDTITSRSMDLAAETHDLFLKTTVNHQTPVPVATTDHVFVIRIPIGITLRIR